MESLFVQFNGLKWRISLLGESVILLTCTKSDPTEVRQSGLAIEKILGSQLYDITISYESIALFSDLPVNQIISKLQNKTIDEQINDTPPAVEVPICYELGSDILDVADYTGLSSDELIKLHLEGVYEVAMIGFLPGFVYAEGLHQKLYCPRKEVALKHVSKGSVGIGGSQTGIYSFDSPGGWNIIGRTPIELFQPECTPPVTLLVGSPFTFYRITEKEFDKWKS